MRRRYAFMLIAASLGLAAGIGVLEIGVRLFVPRAVWDFDYQNNYMRVDPTLGWSPKPDVAIEAVNEAGTLIAFKSNGDGILPLEARREKRRGTLRILMIGDSTTVGRNVPDEARVHRQLEQQLRERGIMAEVLNGGVEGYATDQDLLRLEALGPLYAPDIVIYTVCPDDEAQNSVDRFGDSEKPRFELSAKGGLHLLPPKPPREEGRRTENLSELIQHSGVYRVIQPRLRRFRTARLNGGHAIDLADETWYSPAALEKLDWKLFEALLVRMDASSRTMGSRFYVALHPAIEEVWEPFIADTIRRAGIPASAYDRHAREGKVFEIAARTGIAHIPQIDEFQKRASEGPFHLLPLDPHCNEVCYRITAGLYADRIAADMKPVFISAPTARN